MVSRIFRHGSMLPGPNHAILIPMRVIALTLFVLLALMAWGCASLRSPSLNEIRTHGEVSSGIRIQHSLYFLHHYTLYQTGTVIIPMFVSTNPRVHWNTVTLYHAELDAEGQVQQLVPLTQVRLPDQWSNRTTASHSRGTIDQGQVVFTYPAGWDSDAKQTVYASIAAPVTEPPELLTGSGYTAVGYEEVGSTRVWEYVGVLEYWHWGLPTAVDVTESSIAELVQLIISGDGDRYAVAAAIRELDQRQERTALAEVAAQLYRQLQPRSAAGGGFAAVETRLVHTVMTETLLHSPANAGRDPAATGHDISGMAAEPLLLIPGDLHRAAYQNRITQLQQLVADGADPNELDRLGIPPVTYAVLGGSPRALAVLSAAGADLEQPSAHGTPPWFIAAHTPVRRSFVRLWKPGEQAGQNSEE
ncbi:ankyrin repeat domain-containing protein [Spirochaeta africana]|uniref:Uncharacterized protein n=1 Tax=Spirochaeta africana (strain ATCC 700263 / DSM 8902 / Z-7692) TaxID=889378 RepID=H9UL16_SPIAZ|nr:ankyrin repeat domain-containing protein [Spirochaeta africana]AFG38209.1 hypothetical protein Spiaf_2172 [Spirochaeta africana DSM 8902]